jgi:hypothetical protein
MLFQRGVKVVSEKIPPLEKGDQGGFRSDCGRTIHRIF